MSLGLNKIQTLSGKVALITGARSERGMGYATACKLAEAGADVVISARFSDHDPRRAEFDALGKNIANTYGVRCLTLAMDVTDRAQVEAAINTLVDELGGLDILFNNAGIGFGELFMDMTTEQLNNAWNVNVLGSFHTTQLAVPQMLKRGGGSIINNSSIYGLGCDAYVSAYCMTKHAIIAMTKTLALELGEQNIRVNAVCPGMVLTDMCDVECELIAESTGCTKDEAKQELESKNAFKRGAEPSEVGDVVLFLASEQSSYISGAAIEVTAGQPCGL